MSIVHRFRTGRFPSGRVYLGPRDVRDVRARDIFLSLRVDVFIACRLYSFMFSFGFH